MTDAPNALRALVAALPRCSWATGYVGAETTCAEFGIWCEWDPYGDGPPVFRCDAHKGNDAGTERVGWAEALRDALAVLDDVAHAEDDHERM